MPQQEGTSKGARAEAGAEAERLAKAQVSREVEEARPQNAIYFIVDFLCKHYPEHLKGFASVWNADPELERERLMVVEFFKAQKLPTNVALHFTNAGFDTLETLCTLTAESLDDIEKFSQAMWLPGHKVRLQQTFADIAGRVRAFTEERDYIIRAASGFCPHPQVVSKHSLLPLQPAGFTSSFPPSTGSCCNSNPAPTSPLSYHPAPYTTTTVYGAPSSSVVTYSAEVTRN
ncbi:uncharacterized protein LOC113147447 [Cyclospora cayetanensis]|uniref:Uncharacterized protein LOC113147447 n=1 Tax=Cyclospora cayetanensis TaxID=88456 RepID=A0A6P6S199_9EIME|nr:uncharacterized protein LOC113147447 [Cyclospora cayetanensis]